MATNITAIGFIGKDIENKNRVFYNGLVYTLGRTFSYTALAVIIFLGADQFKISGIFQQYGEKIIGPLLLLIGIFMFGIIKINFPALNRITERLQNKNQFSYWNVFLLGLVFALAFCPFSAVLFFGMLIPLALQYSDGFLIPSVFALATGLPVIIFAFILTFSVSKLGKIMKKVQAFEKYMRHAVAFIFFIVGIYYTWGIWF